jgi:hypothetical protein
MLYKNKFQNIKNIILIYFKVIITFLKSVVISNKPFSGSLWSLAGEVSLLFGNIYYLAMDEAIFII